MEDLEVKKSILLTLAALISLAVFASTSLADDADEMAKKLQDPLANIKALMTDNDISFNAGSDDEETSYGFQLQPVYAIPFEEQGFNLISRAVIPHPWHPGGWSEAHPG